MKIITKEFVLLDIEDIEEAISKYLGKKISISEIDAELMYCFPENSEEACGMNLQLDYDGWKCDAEDLFYDSQLGGFYLNGKMLGLDETFRPLNEIFNFDVSKFKSFRQFFPK